MTIETVKKIMYFECSEYEQKLNNECGAYILGFEIIDAVCGEGGYWATTTVGYDINECDQCEEEIKFSILFRKEMSDNEVIEKIYQTAKDKVLKSKENKMKKIINELAKSIAAEIEERVKNEDTTLYLLFEYKDDKFSYKFSNDNHHCCDIDFVCDSYDEKEYINMSVKDIEEELEYFFKENKIVL